MAPADWNQQYPLHIEQREKERIGIIEGFMTITYNALRKHDPKVMGESK